MKRFLTALLLLALPLLLNAQLPVEQKDALDKKLEEYSAAIQTLPLDGQSEECDFIIGTCKDSLVRQYVALKLYNHFLESRIMGSENVAVHIFDKWFSDGTVKMKTESDEWAARLFAQLNRPSLIGAVASELELEDAAGELRQIPSKGKWTILFFYDTDCAKCRIESIMLRNILENSDYPVDFDAIYIGRNKDGWKEFCKSELSLSTVRTKVNNLWNPDENNEMLEKYGLLQTPKLFLVNAGGIVAGRNLDALALGSMLQNIFTVKELGYGEDESVKFFGGLLDKADSTAEITAAADEIARMTLENGDTTLFRQMTGDLLYYLSSKRREPYVSGCNYLMDKYILSDNKIWCTQDDSLKIVGLAQMLKALYSKTPVGTKIPDVKVYGTLKGNRLDAQGYYWTGDLHSKSTLIIFYSPDCPVCREQLKKAEENLPKGRRILGVDVQESLGKLPEEQAGKLMDSFDLSGLPFILEINRKGVILGKYLSL